MRRVINTVPALISATDPDGTICLLNSQHRRYCANTATTAAGTTVSALFGEPYATRHRALDAEILAAGDTSRAFEERIIDADGEERILLTTKAPLTGADDTPEGVVTVSLDITDRKQQEQAVVESEQRFRSLVEGSVLGILIESEGIPLFANQTLANLFGYASAETVLALANVNRLFPADEHERIGQMRRIVLAGDSHGELIEFAGRKKDGEAIWVQAQAQRVRWKGQTAVQLTLADVTLRKAYEIQLERQANFDALTGLPNRLLMMDRLRGAILSAERHGHRGAVLFVDLDHFKKVNDTLGHAAGDEVLKRAAEKLTGCVRGEDTVSRIGGDEFTIVLPNIGNPAHAEPVVQKILQAFSQPFLLSDREAFVSASIGVTIFPDDGDDPEALMKNADIAMYRSKQRGRNTFEFFTESLSARAGEQIRIETCLRHALERNELSLLFQPIFDQRSGRLVAAEALLQWHSAELGLVAPERFLPCAEDTGLIASVRDWSLDEGCRQMSRWRDVGLAIDRVVVSMSHEHGRGANLLDAVKTALDRHGLPGRCLGVEVSERSLVRSGGEIEKSLRAIRALGVDVTIDDFGAGAASLGHLRNVPADELRLDRAFFAAALPDRKQARIVQAIVAMAHSLGMRVATAGIESESHLTFARACGCDLIQGAPLGAALAADDFCSWAWHHGVLGTSPTAAGYAGAAPLTKQAARNATN